MSLRYRRTTVPVPAVADDRVEHEVKAAWAEARERQSTRPTTVAIRHRLRRAGSRVGPARITAAILRLEARGELPDLPYTDGQLRGQALRERRLAAAAIRAEAALIRLGRQRPGPPPAKAPAPPPPAEIVLRDWVREHMDRERRILRWD